jgi:predicted Zn-ribbon and HTH transcriptional regulator
MSEFEDWYKKYREVHHYPMSEQSAQAAWEAALDNFNTIKNILKTLENFQKIMKPKDRLLLWSMIRENYCPNCGYELKFNKCYCENDE